MKSMNVSIHETLKELEIFDHNQGTAIDDLWLSSSGKTISSRSPVDGSIIAHVQYADDISYEQTINTAQASFNEWQKFSAPHRGDIIRQVGNELRTYKQALGTLVSYEMGKSLQEGLGEVQEMIDICDFAVGLSRQLYGLTMHSERPGHRMYEQWHPLGVVGIISAFNFPVAVWCWNTALAWVCGNVCVWKPSEKTPLSAIACHKIAQRVFKKNNVPRGVSNLIVGDVSMGKKMARDKRVSLVSATGSTLMGKDVAQAVGQRLGKHILELGGNNAIIITPNADLQIAIPATVFGAIGTAGQRCTTTRRVIIQKDIYEKVKDRLVQAYLQLRVGNPLNETNHMGPLIDTQAVKQFESAIKNIKIEGGKTVIEGEVLTGKGFDAGCYVKPAIYEVQNHFKIVQKETFAPILYLIKYETLEEAIAIQNDVPQGLSSAIMTTNIRESELFLSCKGSDCGIANVNIGTSGAEIGGAFGGEKETGGGRESGSDCWKAYMRRQTNTINYSEQLPLAQGIKFDMG